MEKMSNSLTLPVRRIRNIEGENAKVLSTGDWLVAKPEKDE